MESRIPAQVEWMLERNLSGQRGEAEPFKAKNCESLKAAENSSAVEEVMMHCGMEQEVY